MTARSGGRDQELESDLVAEAFESTKTTTDGTLRLASIEIARTEFLVGGTSSDESVGDDQDFVPDGHHCSLVAAVAHDATVARAQSCIGGARGGLSRFDIAILSHLLPLRVLPLFLLPALSLTVGSLDNSAEVEPAPISS